ncbi:hypothetical protein [Streptomyces sp. NPDC088736]|uniref:hypothetical protein n=1 Tax=Streptomyces sp. NPDC088736 TaxID=3365881 RepID=UPI00381A6A61
MTALLLFEAFDAAATIWRALLVWIVVGAAVATLLLLGMLAGLVWVGRRVWRSAGAPLAAWRALAAWQAYPDLYRPSMRPSWAAAA